MPMPCTSRMLALASSIAEGPPRPSQRLEQRTFPGAALRSAIEITQGLECELTRPPRSTAPPLLHPRGRGGQGNWTELRRLRARGEVWSDSCAAGGARPRAPGRVGRGGPTGECPAHRLPV